MGSPPHGQLDAPRPQRFVHAQSQPVDRPPLLLGIRPGHPWILVDPGHLHRHIEFALARINQPGDRSGRCRLGSGGQRQVPLTGEQSRGGIQPHPPRPRQIHLGPGMQIGEVLLWARRAIERLFIRLQLNQVPRHKPRRQSPMTQQLGQQPGRIAARPTPLLQRLLASLHPRLEADQIADRTGDVLIHVDQPVDRPSPGRRGPLQKPGEPGRQRHLLEIRRQFGDRGGGITERKLLGRRLQEEIERVDDRHFRDEIHLDHQFPRRVGKDQPRQIVAEGILLPVQILAGGFNLQRIRQNGSPAMGSRTQANGLRPEFHHAVIAVARAVMKGDVNGHGCASTLCPEQCAPNSAGRSGGWGKLATWPWPSLPTGRARPAATSH